jgi:ribulose-phosphate 3-epimerase
MKPPIVPGVIANNQNELDEMLEAVRGEVDRVMLDVMDGEFVPNKSLDFDFKVPTWFEYEAHLMIKHPLKWIEKNYDKVMIAILHVETLKDIEEAIAFAKERGLKVTLAMNPETKLDTVLPHLNRISSILILTVEPGQYGAPFVPKTLDKIKRLRKIDKTIPIEVDGAMNPQNIKLAKEAGATIFASGSYVMKSENPKKAIKELEAAVSGC